MSDETTIQIKKSTARSIKELKDYPRETYNETIEKMVKAYKSVKERNQYDEFLHKIQQEKMKDLWNNKEDEAWEDV